MQDYVHRPMSTSWIATRLGIDPVRVNAMRRAGELLATRSPASFEWLYPAWQFGPDGQPLPVVARLVRAAREAGVAEEQLAELLERRAGVVGERRRLVDLLLGGDEDAVVRAIRSAGAAARARS
jgi:hypothetical protein